MTFGFNYKIQVSSGELVYRNVAPANNYVPWNFNFLWEEILEVLNIKNKKGKLLRCELTSMLIALAVVSIFYSPWVTKSLRQLSNWAYMCIKSLDCILNSYIFNCHLYLNKAGGKMILKKALMCSNIFYKSTCKNGRMLIIFYRWALWGFIILFFWYFMHV